MPSKKPFKLSPVLGPKAPRMYKVLAMTDGKTPDVFICALFAELFGLTLPAARKLTQSLREYGEVCLGVYSHEIADMKASLANDVARHKGHEITFLIKVT